MRYPLLPYSQLVYDMLQRVPGVYQYGPVVFRMNATEVDEEKLCNAVVTALKQHPVFQTRFDDNGQEFVESNDILNGTYHNISIYRQYNSIFLSFTVNRILGDTYSIFLLFRDILLAYQGKQLQNDDYYAYLNRLEAHKNSDKYARHREWLESEFGKVRCPVRPRTDFPLHTAGIPVAGIYTDLYDVCPNGGTYRQLIKHISDREHISEYTFFTLCTALAIMDYEDTDQAALTWAYLGRDTLDDQNIFGSLHKDIPLKIDRSTNVESLFRQARNQTRSGIAHSDFPLTLTAPYNKTWDYAVNVLHQPSPEDLITEIPFHFEIAGQDSDRQDIAYSLLDIEIENTDGSIRLVFKYSATHYREESIRRLARLIKRNAEWLLGIHHLVTLRLQSILDENEELHALMEQTLETAAEMCPDRRMNPVRSIDDLLSFLDRFLTSMPWQSLGLGDDMGMFRRMDQSTGYFLFLFDQPLKSLEDKGYLYPSIQYIPVIAEWIKSFNNAWREFLDSSDSWNDVYYGKIASDRLFGLDKGWYEPKERWHTWNGFFSRRLSSPAARPIGNANVTAPADGILQPCISIDSESRLVVPDYLPLKTSSVRCVADLLGDSPFRNEFAGGHMVHQMLDFYDYHRLHSPVNGTIADVRIIDGYSGSGGVVIWDDDLQRYAYHYPNELGFQMIETRGVMVIDTGTFGKVAVVPVGMAQVCSVNWTEGVSIGTVLRQGDELGCFLCGGSDVILLFQKGFELHLFQESGKQLLMGQAICNITGRN